MKRRLFLILKRHWFNEIVSGRKTIEYRANTPYWRARLLREYDTVTFQAGYSKHNRHTRRVVKIDMGLCPYPGWRENDVSYFRIHLGEVCA